MTPEAARPLSDERSCAFCNWHGDIGATAHATLIHPGEDWAVVPQMGHEFVIDMRLVRAAARTPDPVDEDALRWTFAQYETDGRVVILGSAREAAEIIAHKANNLARTYKPARTPDPDALREALRAEVLTELNKAIWMLTGSEKAADPRYREGWVDALTAVRDEFAAGVQPVPSEPESRIYWDGRRLAERAAPVPTDTPGQDESETTR